MNRLFIPLAALLLFASLSCDTTEPNDEWMEPNDALPEIELHVEAFLAEAEARGRTPALYRPDELIIVTEPEITRQGEDACGYGELDAATQRPKISFAISRDCWDRSSSDREILVFHELGHALLGRGHRDDALPNGLRASIMFSGAVFGLYSEARADWRQYYVDELFNPSTPAPVWGY